MALSITKGYTFGATELVTHTKLHSLVDDATISLTSQAAGDIMYYNGTAWVRLAKGSAGETLTMNAGGTAPEWA